MEDNEGIKESQMRVEIKKITPRKKLDEWKQIRKNTKHRHFFKNIYDIRRLFKKNKLGKEIEESVIFPPNNIYDTYPSAKFNH